MEPIEVALITFVAAAFGAAAQGFFSQKGKNLADKKDIAEITTKIEEVKHEFEAEREDRRAFNQSRFVAADKRLDKHQEAFSLALELMQSVHRPECMKKVDEIQAWLKNNALYLTPRARMAMIDANHSASQHTTILDINRGTGNGSEKVQANWKVITDLPEILQKEADLPNFNTTSEQKPKLIDKDAYGNDIKIEP